MPEPLITTYPPESNRDVPNLELEGGREMEQLRCANCGRFLCYIAIVAGVVRIKCRKCKVWVTAEIIPDSTLDIFENGSYNSKEVEEDVRTDSES